MTRLGSDLAAAARRVLRSVVVAYQADIKTTLSRRGTGRIYRVAKGRRNGRNLRARGYHQASAPFNPPAADTGNLRRSWQTGNANATRDETGLGNRQRPTIVLGSRVKYARWLQQGTSRMLPRPYVDVAAQSLIRRSGRIERIAAAEMRIVLRRHYRPRAGR